jgi:hypothetical protein
VGEPRLQRLAEHREPLGQLYSVQPVLDVRVIATDMQLAETVLRHAGRLQQQLIERHGVALGNRLDALAAEAVGRGAEARLDLAAGRIQLPRDDVEVDVRHVVMPGIGSQPRRRHCQHHQCCRQPAHPRCAARCDHVISPFKSAPKSPKMAMS